MRDEYYTEPHGRGVPEVVPKGRSPGDSPHERGLARGEQPLGTTEGTSIRVVLFLLYPSTP